jgi:Alpha-2,8-polysialyltransferase (POLYST)
MNIFVCSTFYHVYVSLLIHFNKDNNKKSIFILTSHDSEMKKSFPLIIDELKSLKNVQDVFLRNRSRFLDNLMIEKFKDFYLNRIYFRKSDISKATFFLFGWNQYHLYRTNVPFYNLASNVVLVEEGARAYQYIKPSKYNILIKKLFGMKPNFYKKDKTKQILVQFPEKYNNTINMKSEKLNFNIINEQLTLSEKQTIINVFLKEETQNLIKIQLDNKSNKKKIIVLTQPLSEDGFESEDKKIASYKEIIDTHPDEIIFIKQHPREKTVYKFKNVVVLDKMFPSELLAYFNFKFDKAIGICTSAIYQVDAKEHINTKEDYFK